MTVVFTPPKNPDARSYSLAVKAKVRRAEFEGGYSQRSRSGPNAIGRTIKLSFSKLTLSQKDQIIQFLTARGGVEAFTYQLPGQSEAMLWSSDSWVEKLDRNKTHWIVTINLKQEFDLA